MEPPYAAFDIVRRLTGNVEADVISEIRAVEQQTLGKLSQTGQAPSVTWLFAVADAVQEHIDARKTKLLAATADALRTHPPDYIGESTSIQITNYLMDDLGRYYAHGDVKIRNLAERISFTRGLPPDLRERQESFRTRLTAQIEVLLAQVFTITESKPKRRNLNRVFVVHGRNEACRIQTCKAISSWGLTPVVLHEQPNEGRTIIEKFENHSEVGFAVIILTGDDHGKLLSDIDSPLKARPRQNVVLEFGFFLGKLGRSNVCALYERGVDLPSDYDGVLWIELTSDGSWKDKLKNEIQAAGLIS